VTEKIEKFFSYPVDVEWALSNGKMYILQSRPVTILVRT
jgi:phosphoenolpyruvate synthase/pyruvate phosphate dikinase